MAKTKHHKYERVKLLPNVIIPDLDICTGPFDLPWDAKSYAHRQKILELGCGKGEHSLGFAAANGAGLYVGVDIKSHRLCVGGEQALARGIDNLFFLRAQVEQLHVFFKARSIHGIWLTFPDPHPKQRSIKRRLTSPLFLDLYARLLVPGGTVHLKTDSSLLFNYSRQLVDDWGGRVVAAFGDIHADLPGDLGGHNIVSAFEAKALARAETIKYLAFTLN